MSSLELLHQFIDLSSETILQNRGTFYIADTATWMEPTVLICVYSALQ
jgi:hypothetical protein